MIRFPRTDPYVTRIWRQRLAGNFKETKAMKKSQFTDQQIAFAVQQSEPGVAQLSPNEEHTREQPCQHN